MGISFGREELLRELSRRAALKVFWRDETPVFALRGGAQNDQLGVGEFDGHGRTLRVVSGTGQSGALTDTSPGSMQSAGRRVLRAAIWPRRSPAHTLSFEGDASRF